MPQTNAVAYLSSEKAMLSLGSILFFLGAGIGHRPTSRRQTTHRIAEAVDQ
jgi:hypothetical protein